MVTMADILHFLPEFPDLLKESEKITRSFNEQEGLGNRIDPTHDVNHIVRVMTRCIQIAPFGTRMRIVLIAAIFHDCRNYPKESPLRNQSSFASAQAFKAFMESPEAQSIIQLSWATVQDIAHVIEAHSYSAGIKSDMIEAHVLSDADKLDALGAIGIARCFAYAGMSGRLLYNPDNLIDSDGNIDVSGLNELKYSLDHFHTKLYKLPEKMHTPGGLTQALSAVAFMKQFEQRLVAEVPNAGNDDVNGRPLAAEWYSYTNPLSGNYNAQIRKTLSIFGCPTRGVEDKPNVISYGSCSVLLSLINSTNPRVFIVGIPETTSPIPVDTDAKLSIDLQMLIVWINLAIGFNASLIALATWVLRFPDRYREKLIMEYEMQCARWDDAGVAYDRVCVEKRFDIMKAFTNQMYFKSL